MYTILVQDDNTIHASKRKRIMQGSKNIDNLRFLVKPSYNEIDMTELSAVLTYILPISKERKTLTLTRSEELYKDRLEYKILLNDDENFITSEIGDIKLWLTFKKDDEVVRYTTSTYISIYKREEDENASPETTSIPTVDNIYLDRDTSSIYLTSNGETVGSAISINALSNAIVDTTKQGLITVITD